VWKSSCGSSILNCSLKSSIGKVPWMRIVSSSSCSTTRPAGRTRLDLADDFLEQVLEGHDPLHAPVFVDDDRHVLVRAPELGQQGGQILRLGTM